MLLIINFALAGKMVSDEQMLSGYKKVREEPFLRFFRQMAKTLSLQLFWENVKIAKVFFLILYLENLFA